MTMLGCPGSNEIWKAQVVSPSILAICIISENDCTACHMGITRASCRDCDACFASHICTAGEMHTGEMDGGKRAQVHFTLSRECYAGACIICSLLTKSRPEHCRMHIWAARLRAAHQNYQPVSAGPDLHDFCIIIIIQFVSPDAPTCE